MGCGEMTTPNGDSLWELLRGCFDTDDGSLPVVSIEHLSPGELAAVYAMLRRRSRLYRPGDEFWSLTDNASLPIESVPNAAALVATGQAEAFHFGVVGLVANQVKLPQLGVFVFPGALPIDYKMGPEWGPAEVTGFLELLFDCCALATNPVLTANRRQGPPYPERFHRAWELYCRQRRSEE